MSTIEELNQIDKFIKQLGGLTFTNQNQVFLAEEYKKITNKKRLSDLIKNVKLQKRLKIVKTVAEPQTSSSASQTPAPSPPTEAFKSLSAPQVPAPLPPVAGSKKPATPGPLKAPPISHSGAAAAKNEKKMEITQNIDFNNYTDFEDFLTNKINIINTVATAALKIENSDFLGKSIFLDLKTITEKLDLKNIKNKKIFFLKGLKYNPRFRSLLLYSETTTATIFRNGKMIIKTKLNNSTELRKEAIKFASLINKNSVFKDTQDNIVEEIKLKFKDFEIVNVVGAADVMFNVDLKKMSNSDRNKQYLTYELEKFSGLIFNCYKPKVTIIIFRTGKIILMGAKTSIDVKTAFKNILPILCLNR